MALDPDFHKWLCSRGLQPATLSVLKREDVLQASTLKLLSDSDLESLKSHHGISLGQFALLRGARDDLLSAIDDGYDVVELTEVAGPGGERRTPWRRSGRSSAKYTKGDKSVSPFKFVSESFKYLQ